ncbi:MAG: transposase InsO family protein [Oceanospirillaceae bacterium]|jgi:transposase InsO family protein
MKLQWPAGDVSQKAKLLFIQTKDVSTPVMIGRGNCHDNACAESFFALLKRERVRRKVYRGRVKGKADVFNYIELF